MAKTVTRTVICRKYKAEMEGLEAPPIPGPGGQDIYENISKKAWLEWQARQTMLINERHLNLLEPASRNYLKEQMALYMENKAGDDVEGFSAPE